MFRQVVGQGLWLCVTGAAIGLLCAFGLSRFLQSLFGVEPPDLLTFATASVLMAVVGLLASWLPARRAATIDPAVTLRHE